MDLQLLFSPRSIAVVGVSHEEKKVGHIVAKNIIDQGFQGELFFVNPHAKTLLEKKAYANLLEIHQPIDLVVLAVPANVSLLYLEDIHTLGIKNVVMFAAGFKETDDEGKRREEELARKAKEYGIAVLGPNCIGYVNTHTGVNATFLKYTSPKGNIGFISQSGALGSALLDYFVDHKRMGFSHFISLGNKTVIDEADCLEYLGKDPNTDVIGMYLEDVKHGEKFRAVLQEVTKHKPVVILKSGKTQEGSKAALSHTGGLVGDDQVYESVFQQCGAISADGYHELLTFLKMYSYGKVPISSSILVLSNAGGVGVLLTDELVNSKLSLVTISEKTKDKITADLKEAEMKKISIHNPIDLLGDASAFDYKSAILATMQEEDVGAIIVLLTPQANTQIEETAQAIAIAQVHFNRPIYPVFLGEHSVKGVQPVFEKHGLVSFVSYDGIAVILKKILESQDYRKNNDVHSFNLESLSVLAHEPEICDILTANEKKPFVNTYDSHRILDCADIPVASLLYVQHPEELAHAVRKLHFPVAAKIASEKITHKTEVKGVYTNIKTEYELRKVFKALKSIPKSTGMYVQKMVSGQELLVGAKRDKTFGPVVLVGIGGIYTELIGEVVRCVYPFSFEQFEHSLLNGKLKKLVQGYRGMPPINTRELYSIAVKVAYLIKRFPEISELEMNPLFATSEGLVAADSRVILTTS